MAGQSQGAQSQLAIDVSAIDTNSDPLHMIDETLTAAYDRIDDGARSIRGSRSHIEERVSEGLVDVSGSIWLHAAPDELNALLPWALGTAEAGDVFDVAETVPSRNIAIDHIAKVHTYNTCYVNRMIVSGQKGKPVQFEFQIMGTSLTEGNSGTFPALTFSTDRFYAFHEGVLTMEGGTELFDRFVLVLDNKVEREYNNSKTATDLVAADREVWFACSTPYTSDETALFTTPEGSVAGAAMNITFTNGGQSIVFALGNMKIFPRTPNVRGKKQIRLPIKAKGYKTGSTPDLKITSDSTA